MSSSSRNLYVALGVGAMMGLLSKALADNWEFLPRIEAGGTYNDNYRMAVSPADRLEVYGPYLDAQFDAALNSPISKLDIVPRVRTEYFPTDTSDDSTDEYLDVDGAYTGLRWHLKGIAQYADETVIASELLPATFPGVQLGQTVGGYSGRVGIRNRRQLEHVAPLYTYDVTQRAHLDLGADYQRATFGKSLVQQIGFDNYLGRAGMLFDVTQRSGFSVTGVAAHFQPQSGGHDTNRYGVDLEWNTRPTEILQAYARAGVSRVQAHTALGVVDSNGITGGAGVEWRYQITQVVLDVLRDLAPSDAGAEVVNNELRVRVLHAFQPRFSGFFGARAVRLRGASSNPVIAIHGEDYFTTEVGVDYQMSLSYRIEAAYDLTWQRFQTESSASSNAVRISLIYQPLSQYEPLPEFTGIPQEP